MGIITIKTEDGKTYSISVEKDKRRFIYYNGKESEIVGSATMNKHPKQATMMEHKGKYVFTKKLEKGNFIIFEDPEENERTNLKRIVFISGEVEKAA